MHSIVRFSSDYKWYICGQTILTFVYGAAAILKASSFHGIMFVFSEMSGNKPAGLASLVELSFWAALTVFSAFTMNKVREFKKNKGKKEEK
jgi:hypothetical protein